MISHSRTKILSDINASDTSLLFFSVLWLYENITAWLKEVSELLLISVMEMVSENLVISPIIWQHGLSIYNSWSKLLYLYDDINKLSIIE